MIHFPLAEILKTENCSATVLEQGTYERRSRMVNSIVVQSGEKTFSGNVMNLFDQNWFPESTENIRFFMQKNSKGIPVICCEPENRDVFDDQEKNRIMQRTEERVAHEQLRLQGMRDARSFQRKKDMARIENGMQPSKDFINAIGAWSEESFKDELDVDVGKGHLCRKMKKEERLKMKLNSYADMKDAERTDKKKIENVCSKMGLPIRRGEAVPK